MGSGVSGWLLTHRLLLLPPNDFQPQTIVSRLSWGEGRKKTVRRRGKIVSHQAKVFYALFCLLPLLTVHRCKLTVLTGRQMTEHWTRITSALFNFFAKKKISGFFSKCKETCFALGCLLVPCSVSPPRKPQMWFEKWKQFVDIRVWQHELLLIETSIQCQWWWGRIRGEFYHSDRCGFNQRKKNYLQGSLAAIGALPTGRSHDGRETVTGFGEKMIVEPIIRRISYQTRPAKQ